MSYVVVTDQLPSSKKFTLELWWRVPQKTLDKVIAEAAAYKDSGGNFNSRPPLIGIIPLVIFGDKRFGKRLRIGSRVIGHLPYVRSYTWDCPTCTWHTADQPGTSEPLLAGFEKGYGPKYNMDPSYIGIDCTMPDGVPRFSVNLVMPEKDIEITSSGVTKTFDFSGGEELSQYTSDIPCGTGSGCESGAGVGNHVFLGPGDYGGDEDDGNPLFGCAPGILPFGGTYTTTYTSVPGEFSNRTRAQNFRTLPRFPGGFTTNLADEYIAANDPINEFHDIGQLVSDLDYDPDNPSGQEVTGDHWHHAVISVDLSDKVITKGTHVDVYHFGHEPENQVTGEQGTVFDEYKRTTSACRMFISYDNVNLTKKQMSHYWPTGYKDPNAITTVLGHRILTENTVTGEIIGDNCFGHLIDLVNTADYVPKYEYEPPTFSFGDKLGFPGNEDYVEAIREVELGRFQLYIGDTLDTTLQEAREVFIKPSGRPASIGKAKKWFGRKADVIIDGVGNWQNGINTGSASDAVDGSPVGQIDPYTPSPNLYGDQGQ